MRDFVSHSPGWSFEPLSFLFLFWKLGSRINEEFLMPAKREYASSPPDTSTSKYKVPFFSWIKILIGECQDAENIRGFVVSKSIIDLSWIELLYAIVIPLSDFMMLIEVLRCISCGQFASFFRLEDNLSTRNHYFNLACPEESLTVSFELLTRLFVNYYVT